MIFKKFLSTLSALIMALSCAYVPASGAVTVTAASEADEYEQEPIFIPDFPQDILDEFGIDWTGLAANRKVDDALYDLFGFHNWFCHDGGYAMYGDQSYNNNSSYTANWHNCNSYKMYQSKEYLLPQLTDFAAPVEGMADLRYDISFHCQISELGDLKFGPLLELNGGSDELYVIERFTSDTDFSDYVKIGSYTSDGNEYFLYKPAAESADEYSTVRYYAVNQNGAITAPVIEDAPPVKISSDISEHLKQLNKLTEISTKLDGYGILTEGKEGIGNLYHTSKLVSSYFNVPEIITDNPKYGLDVEYHKNFIETLDGYRVSCHTSDSSMPIITLEDGQYEYTTHENRSYVSPRAKGNLVADISEGMTSTVSVGKEYDGNSSVLDGNYVYDYYYSINNDKVAVSAVVWLLDPYVKIDFVEETEGSSPSRSSYVGTIDLNGEVYDIYNSSIYDNDAAPLLEEEFKGYTFIHKNNSGVNYSDGEIHRHSVPITAALKAAQTYGLEFGNLARISLNASSPSEGYYLDITGNTITEFSPLNPGSVYVDATNNDVDLNGHTFSGKTDGYMYGYEDGSFEATCKGGDNGFFDSITKLDDAIIIDPQSDKHTVLNYKVVHDLDDNYQTALIVSGTVDHTVRTLYVIEDSKNFKLDDIVSFPQAFDFYSVPSDPEFEYVKSYTSGGHDYDLYKVNYVINGFSSSSEMEVYAAVRKDQAEGGVLSGAVDITDHFINIGDESLISTPLTEVRLGMDTKNSTGKINANYSIGNDSVTPPEDIFSEYVHDEYVNVNNDTIPFGDHSFSGFMYSGFKTGYMHGYKDGAFSASIVESDEGYFDSSLRLDEGVAYNADSNKHITVDYKFEHTLDKKYQAALRTGGMYDNVARELFIIENSNDFDINENIYAPSAFDYYATPKDPKFEYVKSYTSGGHEYDLYKVNYRINNFGGSTEYVYYATVRKDQQSGGKLTGTADITDHLIKIGDEALLSTPLTEFTISVDVRETTGTVDAFYKVNLDKEVIAEDIIGDFNGDDTIDSMDLIAARKTLIAQFSDEKKPAPKKMDLNKNGSFEIADVVVLQSYIMGKIDSFPNGK